MNDNKKEIKALVEMRHWRESQARRMLDLWKQSDNSLLRFCKLHGIGYKRVLRWRRILEKRMPAVEFVEMHPFERAELSDNLMEICLTNGRSVKVRPGFNSRALREVIDIAEDSVC
jgi:hypothetical protein